MIGGHGWILIAAAMIGANPDHGGHVERAASQQATNSFAIAIDGSPGVKVVAACLVDWGEDVDVVTLKGEVPLTRKVEAVGLSCQIKKVGNAGKLVVESQQERPPGEPQRVVGVEFGDQHFPAVMPPTFVAVVNPRACAGGVSRGRASPSRLAWRAP